MKDKLYAYFESQRLLCIDESAVDDSKLDYIDKIRSWYKRRAIEQMNNFDLKIKIVNYEDGALDELNMLLSSIDETSFKKLLINLFFDQFGFFDEETHKDWLKKNIEKYIEKDVILINEETYRRLVDYTGKVSITKPKNVVFDENKNELSLLIDKAINIYGVPLVLDFTNDKIIKANLKFYSPNERDHTDFELSLDGDSKLIDLSEASLACDEAEVNEDEVDAILETMITDGYLEIHPVCEQTQLAFECAGVNLPLVKNVKREKYDQIAQYLTQSNLEINEIGHRYDKIKKFFNSYPHLVCKSENSRLLDEIYSRFSEALKNTGSYRSVSLESNIEFTRSKEIKTLGERILSAYFEEIECHEKFGVLTFKCKRDGFGEFYFIFCFNANIGKSILKPFAKYDLQDKIFCIKPFAFKKQNGNLILIKEGFLQNEYNLNTFAKYDKLGGDLSNNTTIKD